MTRLLALPAVGQTQTGLLEGAAGAIESVLAMPADAPRGVAVICHPHPLHGGALTNKVAYTLASCALKAGLVALRFNFRGVGASAGTYDHARGETEDCIALAHWLSVQAPGSPLLLAGFSFGAFVALNAAARVKPAALVGVAPPLGTRYIEEAPTPPHPGCPWLVLHSRDDDVVPYEDTRAQLEQYQPAPELVSVDGAGHLFHGHLHAVQDAVLPFLTEHLNGQFS